MSYGNSLAAKQLQYARIAKTAVLRSRLVVAPATPRRVFSWHKPRLRFLLWQYLAVMALGFPPMLVRVISNSVLGSAKLDVATTAFRHLIRYIISHSSCEAWLSRIGSAPPSQPEKPCKLFLLSGVQAIKKTASLKRLSMDV